VNADVIPDIAKITIADQTLQLSLVIPDHDGRTERQGSVHVQTRAGVRDVLKKCFGMFGLARIVDPMELHHVGTHQPRFRATIQHTYLESVLWLKFCMDGYI